MSAARDAVAASETDIRLRFGLRPVINLTGTLTDLGGSSARPEAIEAAAAMMARGVDIVAFQARASQIIAAATGAEAGFVSACSSAGICMAVAGAMTGDSLAAIERLPDTHGLRNQVVMQTGHLVNYGHPIAQDVRQTGAELVNFGTVNSATVYQLEGAITENTAAALYVVSHHCAPDGQIGFSDFVRVCHAYDVPVIVDLAAEYALQAYLAAGADITIHSAHKFLRGATAGIVCGRKALVRAAYLQNLGIGRPMKVGKEGIAAALVALQCFVAEDRDAERTAALAPLHYWCDRLADYAGVQAEIDPDPTDNPFDRLRVTVSEAAGLDAVELMQELETGDPPIRVRAHQLEHGSFVMDPRSMAPGEEVIVADRLCAILDGARDGTRHRGGNARSGRARKMDALSRWPDLDSEPTA